MRGCRSSDFCCMVQLPVAVSTASMMSLAMLRGRLVLRLLRVVGEADRTLAAICILDIGRGQMQRADHGLTGVGPHLGQSAFQPFSRRSEGAERIRDPDAPVRAGNDLAGYGSAL